ncbi:hypothetical protein [Roseospira navarrensis]|uniref:Uncharacterized protein n=1 Tax=Roseospira navarrensis TaxID=140058 RepID=A0A7X1ZEG1_9PROT|nr:hypothetical protein [Roseospira navarrensis]MQX37055.1 hypothetical protein [Roseospira navarrensis]
MPEVPEAPTDAFAHQDDVAYLEAIFGRHDNYVRAMKKLRRAADKNRPGASRADRLIWLVVLIGFPLVIGAAFVAHYLRTRTW